MKSGAKFSDCRKYRYSLWRFWDDSLPYVIFIGLNPSKADGEVDDPTMRRVIQFAKDLGYGGVYMVNLFGYIATRPKELLTVDDPCGENNFYLSNFAKTKSDVIFAWGGFKHGTEKVVGQLKQLFPEAKCLGFNNDGSPKHPLYIKADTVPTKYQ